MGEHQALALLNRWFAKRGLLKPDAPCNDSWRTLKDFDEPYTWSVRTVLWAAGGVKPIFYTWMRS